jgi:hypothetical protein
MPIERGSDVTSWLIPGLATLALAGIGGALLLAIEIRRKNLSRWLGPYLRDLWTRPRPRTGMPIDVLLCVADHFEPKSQDADAAHGLTRVRHWCDEYPRLFERFRDSDGRPPRHTYFFPAEEYEPEYLDRLAELCRAGFGEVEIHLHHHDDTPENLRRTLEEFKRTLVERHGLLARDRETGEVRYAFIHGNWALCNSRPDGVGCGVDHELPILLQTGCFVDMTFPSAPVANQPAIINRIYYARDLPGRRASHEVGTPIGERVPEPDELLMIQGPLGFDWSKRKWGLLPRLENGCLQSSQPPDAGPRLDNWLRAGVQAPGRPDWFFVKLHCHGASEDAHGTLLGEPMVRFHEELARRAAKDANFRYHYVTAREMVNLAKAAEAGFRGPVAEARDWLLTSNLESDTRVPVGTGIPVGSHE